MWELTCQIICRDKMPEHVAVHIPEEYVRQLVLRIIYQMINQYTYNKQIWMIKTCIYNCIYIYYSAISEDMLDICHTCHTVQILFPSEDVSDLAPCCDNPCPTFCEKQRAVWHCHPNDSAPLRQETKKTLEKSDIISQSQHIWFGSSTRLRNFIGQSMNS
jgi:hypothetical protein